MWPRRMLQTWSARLKERAMNLLSMEQNGGVVVIYYFVSSDLYEMATGRLSTITPSAVWCPHPLHM